MPAPGCWSFSPFPGSCRCPDATSWPSGKRSDLCLSHTLPPSKKACSARNKSLNPSSHGLDSGVTAVDATPTTGALGPLGRPRRSQSRFHDGRVAEMAKKTLRSGPKAAQKRHGNTVYWNNSGLESSQNAKSLDNFRKQTTVGCG